MWVRRANWNEASKNPSYVFPTSASEYDQVSPNSLMFSFTQLERKPRSSLHKEEKIKDKAKVHENIGVPIALLVLKESVTLLNTYYHSEKTGIIK